MRTTRPLIALITGGALALTACGGPSTTTTSTSGAPATAEPAPSGGTVTMAVTDDPGNLDPSMTVLSVTRGIDRVAYDSLVRLNPKGEVVPNLATKWTVEPTKVTFTLNPDVKCSDGTRFTAKDAADNLAFVSNPANKSPLLGVVVPVGLTSVGDDTAHTLTVTAAEPNAFLLRSLTSMLMVCRAGLDDPKKLATATIGTGLPSRVTHDCRHRGGAPGGPTSRDPGRGRQDAVSRDSYPQGRRLHGQRRQGRGIGRRHWHRPADVTRGGLGARAGKPRHPRGPAGGRGGGACGVQLHSGLRSVPSAGE